MSGSCTVVPGYLLADGELLTEAKLRQMAQPTVTVADGSITDAQLNLPAVSAALGANTRPNLLTNPNFVEPRWAAAQVSAPNGVETWNAEAWFVRPSGGTATFVKSTTVPVNALSLHSVEIGGGAGITTCILGQNIERALSATLARKLTFSAWIYNNTGATYTPQVVISTCNSANDWTALTVRNTYNLTPCSNSAWTRVAVVIDCTTLPNIANGMRIAVQFPTNSLNASGKKWNVSQVKLEVGEAATAMTPDVQWPQQQSVAGTAANLVIQNNVTNPTYQMDVSADELVLKDVRGYAVVVTAMSRTADLTASGLDGRDAGSRTASTWYYLWAVSDGVDHRLLFSTSATAPTLPVGYLYKARLGAVYNGSGNTLLMSHQLGQRVYLPPQQLFSSKGATAANTYQTESLAAMVPPIARIVHGIGGVSTSDSSVMRVAGHSNGIGEVSLAGAHGAGSVDSFFYSGVFSVPLITPQTLYWGATITNARHRVVINGYEI